VTDAKTGEGAAILALRESGEMTSNPIKDKPGGNKPTVIGYGLDALADRIFHSQ
jgi:hypothetical protein